MCEAGFGLYPVDDSGDRRGGHLGMSTVIRFLFRIDGHGLVVKHEYVTSQTCGRENN